MRSGSLRGNNARPAVPGESRELEHLTALARLLDARFRLPGTSFRFGWDAVVGIIPGLGDTVMLLPGLYILFRARRLKMPMGVVIRMSVNLLVDWIFGSIPLLGVLFDAGFKANLRNLRLMRQELEKREGIISV